MNIKKWFLAGGLLAAGLILMVCGRAFALPAYNTGVVDYQNLALTNYETWSNIILVTSQAGPRLTALKEQKRRRAGGAFGIASIAVIYGDSVTYRLTITNTSAPQLGTDVDTAINIYVTDTQTFVDAYNSGDTAVFDTCTFAAAGADSSTGNNSVTTWAGGYTSTVNQIEYALRSSPTTWVVAGGATAISANSGISEHLYGVRWRINQIPGIPGGTPSVYIVFTVRIVQQ